MRFILFFLAAIAVGCGQSSSTKPRVVLYCAQDRPFAEPILEAFTKSTGISVTPVFDSEANKSVGLFRQLQMEAKAPRCDVHWNNEPLTTMLLARDGVYAEYASPSAGNRPKDGKNRWVGFASRARVLLVNTDKLAPGEYPKGLLELAEPKWLDRIGMAKPVHGTTATQAACLFDVLGKDAATKYYRDLKANRVKIYAGNKGVAEAVARGEVPVGMTDTDDAIIEILNKKPVVMIAPDAAGLGTLFMPNTVAVIRNAPNPAAAQKLHDYLLGTEAQLATAGGYQIPLDSSVQVSLPDAFQPLLKAKHMSVNWEKAAAGWEAVQAVLRDEFNR